ncbi:hypothetical protein PG991_014869 [Apiospora marii]|uniref:RING-type domain-containing protein n=1 Tax=Apiospora marii TaxID=335849 RepID=A0ABR1R4S8_9PEZI
MSTQQDESEQDPLTKCEVCKKLEDHGRATEFVPLPCGHDWCLNCLKNAFMTAWRFGSTQPPKCFKDPCKGEEIEATTEILELVGPEVASRYLQARMEHEADINTTSYCHQCSEFIPAPFVKDGKIAICRKCEVFTCRPCGREWHPGQCVEDPYVIMAKKLARKCGYKQCPGCKSLIEPTEGSYHMQ